MALIKCTECGKDISDKAISCPTCGCTINQQKKSKKSIDKWFVILFVLTLILCLVSCFFILVLCCQVMIALILGIVCISIYVLMLFKMKKTKPKILLSILLGIFLIVCICISINELSYINEQDTPTFEDSSINEIDDRTPKEKMIDYLKKIVKAECTETMCTYTFSVYGLNDTSKYTLDFTNKKFILENNTNGKSYTEYNYEKDIGYAKSVTTTGWTVTTEVNVTFDDEKQEYNYTWTGSMQGLDEVAKIMASQVESLRSSLIRNCNTLGVSIKDL